MNNLEIHLATSGLGSEVVTVAKAHDLVLSFQANPAMATTGNINDLSDGNLTVTGKQTLLLQNGQLITTDLKPVQIRVKEQEAIVAAMPEDTAEKLAAKQAAQARVQIWKTFRDSLHDALAVALKANYELECPPVEAPL